MTLSATKPVTLPVLLIEDEPAVMAYVRATLERNGYAVVCTESGAEGLRLLCFEAQQMKMAPASDREAMVKKIQAAFDALKAALEKTEI